MFREIAEQLEAIIIDITCNGGICHSNYVYVNNETFRAILKDQIDSGLSSYNASPHSAFFNSISIRSSIGSLYVKVNDSIPSGVVSLNHRTINDIIIEEMLLGVIDV